MRSPSLQNRVKAHLESAGHAGKGEGGCQVGAAQADALGIEVAAFFGVGFFEPEGLMGFAVVHKLGRDHAARAQHLAVSFEGFVHHCKAVAFAKGAVKVDVARKDVGQLAGHAVGNVGIIGGRKQRTLDGAAAQA
jgi:hypothetical protein